MNPKPLLVQFGAGSIGRSLLGQLFSRAGWEVVFVDVSEPILEALNRRGRYRVTILDDLLPGQPDVLEIENVSGVHLHDGPAVEAALARADLAGTSVGAGNLEGACRRIAGALHRRDQGLPVLLCENLHGAAKIAREHLSAALSGARPACDAHFIEAAISKMVPPTPARVRAADPLEVWAEAYNTLYLDADAYPGNPPTVPGVAWRNHFHAYVDRKLLIHNFGHAAAAYNGFLAGKRFIWECMEDEGVRREIEGCMMESAQALSLRHPGVFTFDENRAWADDLLRRFRNRHLPDTVYRVGRDLARKLAPDDRCLGTLRMLVENGVPFTHTVRAIAAALHFEAEGEDGERYSPDVELVESARKNGPEKILADVCGLKRGADDSLIAQIADEYGKIGKARALR